MDFSKNPPEGIGQCLNAPYELRSLNEKSVFLLEDQLCFYAKNWFFSQKSSKFEFFLFFRADLRHALLPEMAKSLIKHVSWY